MYQTRSSQRFSPTHQIHQWVTGSSVEAQTGHRLTNTNGVKLLICRGMATCEPGVRTAHAQSNMTTQVFCLTGEAKNRSLQEHLPTLAQRLTVFPCLALLIRSGTDAHVWPRSLKCRTSRSSLRKHKDLLCALGRSSCVLLIPRHVWMNTNTHACGCAQTGSKTPAAPGQRDRMSLAAVNSSGEKMEGGWSDSCWTEGLLRPAK